MTQSSDNSFERALELIKSLPKDGDGAPDQKTKLKFYGYYKCATVGTCKDKGGSQPWAVQLEARAKWDAWNACGNMSSDEAKKKYVELLISTTKGQKVEFKG